LHNSQSRSWEISDTEHYPTFSLGNPTECARAGFAAQTSSRRAATRTRLLLTHRRHLKAKFFGHANVCATR